MSLVAALQRAYPGIIIGPGDAGDECVIVDGAIVYWGRGEAKPSESALLAAYDPVPDARLTAKAKVRQQAQDLIHEKWPNWRQQNCALGIYPDVVRDECSDDIASVVEASNTAEDAIDAATTVAAVEAVTATWPII